MSNKYVCENTNVVNYFLFEIYDTQFKGKQHVFNYFMSSFPYTLNFKHKQAKQVTHGHATFTFPEALECPINIDIHL